MSDANQDRRNHDRREEERRLMDRRHEDRGTPDRRGGGDRRNRERREIQPGDMSQGFVRFAIETGALRFGQFETKAKRLSPYFFNAGLFNTGKTLARLADFYATALIESKIEFDMLFGPAYKGITLASATAMALAGKGRDVPYAFNRKEAKDHGEGGTLIGAPMQGRVVIIDDVISAGISVRESVELIRAAGATPAAVLIAIDRQERTGANDAMNPHSAVQEVKNSYGIDVVSIATLDDILGFLETSVSVTSPMHVYRDQIGEYRERYGA